MGLHLLATFQDRAFGAYAARLKALGDQGRVVLAGALNAAGADLRHATVAAETAQTGLPETTLEKAQKATEASSASLAFTIRSEGGNVRLKYFGAEETVGGVTAHPFGQQRMFAHAFIKGGRFPNRVAIRKLNGQVFERTGVGRKIRAVRSGVVIPAEMVKGRTAAAFTGGVETIVATAIVSKLGAMLP